MSDVVETAVYRVAGVDEVAAKFAGLAVAIDKASAADDHFAVTSERVTRATRTTADGLERMIARVDARARAEQQWQRSLQQLARYEQEGVGTAARRAQAMELVTQRYNQQIAAAQRLTSAQNDNTRGMIGATRSSREMQFALTNLSFQVNDVVSGLVSGQQPMRIFAQQAGQFYQVFQQGGAARNVLAEAAASIRGFITPTTLAIGGFGLLAVGVGTVIGRAITLETQARGLSVAITAMGRDAEVTGKQLAALVSQLQDRGLGRADATGLVAGLQRTVGVSQAQIQAIALAAPDIAAGTGLAAADAAKQVAAFFTEGVPAIEKFDRQIGFLTANTLSRVRDLGEAGRMTEAADLAFQALANRMEGLAEKARGPWSQAWLDAGRAIDGILTRLANNPIVQFWMSGLGRTADRLSGQPLFGMSEAEARQRFSLNLPPGPGEAARASIPTPALSEGGGVATAWQSLMAAGATANLSGLNADFASRINAWLDALPEQERTLIRITSAFRDVGQQASIFAGSDRSGRMVAAPGGSAHGFGLAVDATGLSAAATRTLPLFGLHTPTPWEAGPGSATAHWHVEPIETPSATTATAAQRRASFQAFGLGTGLSVPTGTVDFSGRMLGALSPEQAKLLDEINRKYTQQQEILAADQKNRALVTAGIAAEQEARKSGYGEIVADFDKRQALTLEIQKGETAFRDEREAMARATAGANEVAEAWVQSRAAAMVATAGVQAHEAAATKLGVSEDVLRQAILDRQAAEISARAGETIVNMRQQVATAESLAAAELKGAAAVQEVERIEAARMKTRELAAAAEVTRDAGTRNRLRQQIGLIEELTVKEKEQTNARAAAQLEFRQRQDLTIAGAQRDLARETDPIRIQAGQLAVQGLQDEFTIRQQLKGAEESAIENALKNAAAIRQITAETQGLLAIRDKAKSIADDIGQFFVDAFVNVDKAGRSVFTNLLTAVEAGLKRMAANLIVEAAKAQFTTPLTTALVGSAPSLFGLTSSSGSVTLTPNGSGGFTVANVASTASLGNSLFGSSGGGLLSGAGNWLNTSIGGPLGFAMPSSVAGAPVIPGSLFSTTTLTSVLPWLGLALGGGFLLSGLFRNNRPPNQSAGAGFDLATGRITGGFAGGNPQIDQQTLAASQALGNIVASLTAISGGALGGSLLLQNGRNTGVTLDYADVPGFGSGRMSLGRDPLRAVQQIGAALASVTPGAETLATVLTNLVDPSQIDAAIQFASVYDNLKTAADSAFTSIEASKQAGPFEQAKAQIVAIFDEISAKTREFGLALDPVNASLAEAQRRLTADFDQSIQDMILGVTDAGRLLVEEEKRAGEARLREVEAVNGNIAEVNRLNALMLDQIWQSQTQSLVQLQQELTAGSLSGLTVAAQLEAANDNFERTLALVQTGNLAEINNLALYGTSAVSLSQQAYGNAPQTAALIAEILAAIEAVLAVPPFASGTRSTPRGLILVGEEGPEFIDQPGGLRVWSNPDTERMLAGRGFPMDRSFAHGTMAGEPSYAEVVAELRAVRQDLAEVKTLLGAGNTISRVGFGALDSTGKQQLSAMRREPLYEPRRQKVV